MAKRRKSRLSIKKLVLAVVFGIMSAIGASSYFYDLKPLLNMGAEYVEGLFATPLQGNVLHISDGDTLSMLDLDGNELKVRLYGIDAPESDQEYGDEARKALESMIYGKDIALTVVDTDQYGRSVGILEYAGNNINEQLLIGGHAWYYDAYCTKGFCIKWKQLENLAKLQQKGLWREAEAVAPWEWRRR